jgi:hypothetical protein
MSRLGRWRGRRSCTWWSGSSAMMVLPPVGNRSERSGRRSDAIRRLGCPHAHPLDRMNELTCPACSASCRLIVVTGIVTQRSSSALMIVSGSSIVVFEARVRLAARTSTLRC